MNEMKYEQSYLTVLSLCQVALYKQVKFLQTPTIMSISMSPGVADQIPVILIVDLSVPSWVHLCEFVEKTTYQYSL